MQRLQGKVALVTGAGRGLGRATALRLAAEGASVAVNDVDQKAADETVRLIVEAGGKALVSAHDVSSNAAASAMVKECVERLGGLDVLVNNAGILRDALLAKLSEADFDAVIRVNLKGVFNCAQAATEAMKERGGAIVNIASISYLGNVGQTNYAAAKAGVVGMTRTWALELARYGIRVNALAPGLIATDMTAGMPDKIRETLITRIPLGRMGKPEEVAAAVAFLASDDASYITGHVLHLDGGSSVGGL